MQKASANRINNAYVTLQGFLENEAPNIQTLGDPSVQLPLATARSDAHRLNDEILVLKRNPGLESSLTVQDVNAIEANLGYLQKKWRLSTNSVVEPFQAGPKNSFYSFFSGWFSKEPFQDVPEASAAAEEEVKEEEAVEEPAVEEAPVEEEAVEATAVPDSMPVTLNDLNDLSSRIEVETVRLNASGSTDPVIQSRVNTLTEIKTTVDDIASQVQQGYKQIEEVPLTQSDIATFLPIMSNLNSPVPQILNTTGMNPALQNLFQTYSGGDMDGAKLAQEMFDKYAGQLLNNMSWDFNIRYTGQAEQDIAREEASSAMSLAQIVMSEMAPPSSFPGQFQSITQAMGGPGSAIFNQGSSGQASSRIGSSRIGSSGQTSSRIGYPKPPDPSRPSPYDWKKRTSHICQQVAARGMTPSDFGCVEPSSVSENFSWRGNAKMICNRIATLYDPSIPAACGCPPVSWPGWRA